MLNKIRIVGSIIVDKITGTNELINIHDCEVSKYATQLDLRNKDLTSIDPNIKNFKYLERLDLSDNKLVHVPEEIKYFRHLESLHLEKNKLISVSIPQEITTLKELDVSFNELTNFPEHIDKQKDLVYLNVSNNKIKHVPDNVYNLRELYTLNISNNKITHISENIVKLINLEYFKHSGNDIQKTVFFHEFNRFLLPPCLQNEHFRKNCIIHLLDENTYDENGQEDKNITYIKNETKNIIENRMKIEYTREKHKDLMIKEMKDAGYSKQIIDKATKFFDEYYHYYNGYDIKVIDSVLFHNVRKRILPENNLPIDSK